MQINPIKKICTTLFFTIFTIIAYGADDNIILGRQVAVTPQGEYAKIDTKLSVAAIQNLGSGDKETETNAWNDILKNPENYNPPVLCAVSSIYANHKDNQQAAGWFYACILRALSDADKTNDPSAKAAVPTLVRNFSNIDFNKLNKTELVKEAIKWDEQTPRNYDPRWIMLYSANAFFGTEFNFAPKSDWEKINAKARGLFAEKIKAI